MTISDSRQVCKNCGNENAGNYCNNCGNTFNIKRITFASLLHDVFHFMTHLDKGFGLTFKELAIAPGTMQREYIEGKRAVHQKPFSMFFLCATITALVRYWIDIALVHYYSVDITFEGNFFHQYMVIMHTILLPLYALITWLLFFRSGYNYAEIVVLLLYAVGAFFLITDVVALLRLVWPDFNTDYIELIFLLIYNAITFLNFFKTSNSWIVLAKSIVNMVFVYFIANYAQDIVISFLAHQ